jgi:hypothetical protein
MKTIRFAATLGLAMLAGPGLALADTAKFNTTVTGCPACQAVDSTGLVAQASGQLLPNGWTVKAGANGLYVANGIGAVFTLPGKTFDLTGLKLFATNAYTKTTAPVTITLYAFHPGNAIADMVQIRYNSRVVSDLPLTDPRLNAIDLLVASYGPEIGYNYFIETRFTPH